MRLLALSFALALCACSSTLLDAHVRSANELRLANDQAIAPMRALCPTSDANEACAQLTLAQHAFIDAHVAWVHALQTEVAEGNWRRPNDNAEVAALCNAWRALVTRADAVDVQFVPLSQETAHLCAGVHAP